MQISFDNRDDGDCISAQNNVVTRIYNSQNLFTLQRIISIIFVLVFLRIQPIRETLYFNLELLEYLKKHFTSCSYFHCIIIFI